MVMMIMMMMVMMHYTERKNGNSHQHPLDAMMMNRLLLVNEPLFVSAANPFFLQKNPSAEELSCLLLLKYFSLF